MVNFFESSSGMVQADTNETKGVEQPLGWELREIIKTRAQYENPHKLLKYFNTLLSHDLGLQHAAETTLLNKHEAPFPAATKKVANTRLEEKLGYLHTQIFAIIHLIQTELVSTYDNRIRLQRLETKAQKGKQFDTKSAEDYLVAHEKEEVIRKKLEQLILELEFADMTDGELLRFIIGKDLGGLDRAAINSFYIDLLNAL